MFWRQIKNEPKEVLNWRLWASALVFGLMGAARGLDEGVISGTVEHASFVNMVGLNDESKSESELANLKSNITSMVQIGCMGGTILAYLLNDRIGRLMSLRTLAALWIIGVIIQITTFNGVGQIYAGRLIAGLGIGMTAVICPTYLVEISPANVRGLCGCIYSGSVYLGVMISQLANVGTSLHISPTDRNQWVWPTSIQLMWAGLLLIGSFFTVESPRWLFKVGKTEQALENLSKVRGLPTDSPYISWESGQILGQVELESEKTSFWGCVKQLFTTYKYRMLICLLIQLIGQWTGANAITIYAPVFLEMVGITGDLDQLKLTAVLGGVKLASSLIVALFLIDTLGRKRSLMSGIFIQLFSLIYVAAFVARGGSQAAADGAVAMIYLSGFGWALGFNAIQYLINSEIFPLTVRSVSTAIIMTFHFCNQFANSKAVPSMNDAMGYGSLAFFAGITFIGLLFAYFMVPEPAGHSLEAVEELFSQPWYKIAHYKFHEATLEEKEEKVNDVQHVEHAVTHDNRV